jgi:3',5'-cyclic-nucleotide phosphodiesterase
MNLQVLGCAGGIGGREKLTTCLWLDHDILLDAGTGVSSLTIDQLTRIDHVFLTHSHLDHVAGLAFLLDSISCIRNGPVTVHATETVIASLKCHLFNWVLWPDFSTIPTAIDPLLRWESLELGATIDLDGRLITAYPVNHTVDAVAYWVRGEKNGFLFSGDMGSTPELWTKMAKEEKLKKIFVDCSFPNAEYDLAAKSKHFCPLSLLNDIQPIAKTIEFLISHLKPGQEDLILEELQQAVERRTFRALERGDVFIF